MFRRGAFCILFVAALAAGTTAQTTESARLVFPNPDFDDGLGHTVALSGNNVVAGAPSRYVGGAVAGFDFQTGQLIYELRPGELSTGDKFGRSIALNSSLLAVGAPMRDAGARRAGNVYLYDAASGSQLCRLRSPSPYESGWFGREVALSGNTLAVAESLGRGVHLYDVSDAQNPLLLSTIAIDSQETPTAMAMKGGTLLIGSMWDETHGYQSGTAIAYDVSDPAAPVRMQKMFAADASEYDVMGISADFSGNLAIVGAQAADVGNVTEAGAAYLFDLATGGQLAKLTAPEVTHGDYFGASVAIEGDYAIVGASYEDDVLNNAGSAFVYNVSDPASPVLVDQLIGSDLLGYDRFGFAVDMEEGNVVVGASEASPNQKWGAGAVYAYQDVPEPASLVILAIGSVTALRRRRP